MTKTRRLTTEARKVQVGTDALIDMYGDLHTVESVVNIGSGAFGAVLDFYCDDEYLVTLSGSDRVRIVRTYG